jgi:hypothetical protein
MQIVIFSTISIFIIILGVILLRKRIKAHYEQLALTTIESSINIDDPFHDYICIMLTDGSTIIAGKTANGERYGVKGKAR